MGWDVYDVGTVGNDDSNNTTVIVGIVLGILGALVVGAGLALVVMFHLRKKKIGEELLIRLKLFPESRIAHIIVCFYAHSELSGSFLVPVPSANIENRLSTMLSHARSGSAVDFSPTGDYRRGESGRFIRKCRLRKWTFHSIIAVL